MTAASTSKLTLSGPRVSVAATEAHALVASLMQRKGCAPAIAEEVAAHLVDTELCGVESHGVMRALQYAQQYDSGYLRAAEAPRLVARGAGQIEVDGGGGIGIPAMRMAVEACCARALDQGIAAVAARNLGHTGRLGAFAEVGAERGCLVVIVGGGGRQAWRQVAPHGGAKAVLPTNPWCFAIPGGARGPVVVDFATSVIAGGWLHAARAAGALVPEGAIIDAEGRASRDPAAYFAGGAILPKGGAMGYGLAVMAELICEAMLGPVTTEVNWLVLAIDTARWREPNRMSAMAEEILVELRDCPPTDGFARVEVPGERERDRRRASGGILHMPERTWDALRKMAGS